MSFTNLFNKMLVLFACMFLGFIAGKTKILDDDGCKKLNKVLLYICQPALIIDSVVSTGLEIKTADIIILFALATAMNLVLMALGYVLTPLMRVKRGEGGTYRFMIAFGNVLFMGLPVLASLYGDDITFLVFIAGMPFQLIVYSIGAFMIAPNGSKKGLSKKILLNPALLSIYAALILFFLKIKLPVFVSGTTEALGGMAIPGCMLIIGASLCQMSFKEMFADWHMYVLSLVRMVICPIVISLVFRLFVNNEVFLNILVVSAAMPVGVVANILSMEYGGNVGVASRGVFFTTLLSFVTIPIVVYLLVL